MQGLGKWHAHAHAHAHTQTHARTHTHTYTHTHAHTHTTHTHTHAHVHTNTHTHNEKKIKTLLGHDRPLPTLIKEREPLWYRVPYNSSTRSMGIRRVAGLT